MSKVNIEKLKKIADFERLDNIDEQKKIAKDLIDHRNKKLKGKDLTLKERVIIYELLTVGQSTEIEILKEKVETLERKLKQYLFDNLMILAINVALATLLFIMTVGK